MKKIAIGTVILLVATCITASAQYAYFYGTVQKNGENVPDGTTISAWIYYKECANKTINNSVYSIPVPADNLTTPEIDGGRNGTPVVFKINGQTAQQTGIWWNDMIIQLNLTVCTKDLIVTNITVFGNNPNIDPNSIFVDRDTKVNATIKNVGSENTTNFEVVLYVNNNKTDSRNITLNGSEEKIIQFNWHTPNKVGNYVLEVYADRYDEVPECNNMNNNKTINQYVTIAQSTFYGTVQKDGENVPDGTIISAFINGTEHANTTTFTENNISKYNIIIPANNITTNDTIIFKVGNIKACQTGKWQNGTNTQLNLTVCTKPDLIVTNITVKGNYPILDTNAVFIDLDTEVNATIKNDGFGDAVNFYGVLYVNENEIDRKKVTLNGSEEKIIPFKWHTPDNIGFHTIKVVADPENNIPECNDTNNNNTINQYVTENGYKGNKPLQEYKNGTLKGGVLFDFGDSQYISDMNEGDTATVYFNLNTLPHTNFYKVKLARLYVYWTSKSNDLPSFGMKFNDNILTPEVKYTDRKGFGSYDYPSGMYAYNVTNMVQGNGEYIATIVKYGDNTMDLYGMGLLVVFEDERDLMESPNITYFINEGCDLLYSNASYNTTPDDATTSALFKDSIDKNKTSFLYTVIPLADEGNNSLLFNNYSLPVTWNYSKEGQSKIATNNTNVTGYLNDQNVARIQDQGDYIIATNAILIIGGKVNQHYEKTLVSIKDSGTMQNEEVTIPIEIYGVDNLGSGTIRLEYDSSVVKVTEVKNGDFDTIEYNIQNAFNYTLISAYQVNNSELSGEVTFAEVVLKANTTPCNSSNLNLTVIDLNDINSNPIINYSVQNGTFYVIDEPKLNTNLSVSVIINDNKDSVNITVNVTQKCTSIEIDKVTIDLSNIGGDSAAEMKKARNGTNWTLWYLVVNSSKPLSYLQHKEIFALLITVKNSSSTVNVINTTKINLEILRNGDVDKNGYVDIADAAYIARYTVGKETLIDPYNRVADVDGSGDVDISDAMYLAKYIAGLPGFERLK